MPGESLKGRLVRFPVYAYFETDIPDRVAYWERRAFSNAESARKFSEIIRQSQISKIIVKTIYASHGGWIIVGFGMMLPAYEFNRTHQELYYELCKKVGGVYLEPIEDFDEFLGSDYIDELEMTVFSDRTDNLYQHPPRSEKLAKAKIRLRKAADAIGNEKLARLLNDLEQRYLVLRPDAEERENILDIMKLCDTVTDGVIRQVYRYHKLGIIGRKTLGQLVPRIIDEEVVSKRIGFEIQTLVSYRNKVEHYDVLDRAEYELSKSDLELVMCHMLDLVEYCLGQGILERSKQVAGG